MTVPVKSDNVQNITKKNKDKIQEQTFGQSVAAYFKGVKSEWYKITWPDKQQVLHETLIVIFVSAFFTLLIYFIDVILKWLILLIPVR